MFQLIIIAIMLVFWKYVANLFVLGVLIVMTFFGFVVLLVLTLIIG